jgi:hypothetical protein
VSAEDSTNAVTEQPNRPAPRRTASKSNVRTVAVIGLAALLGVVVWLIVRDDDGGQETTPASPSTAAVEVTPRRLRTLAGTLDQPVFWAGAQRGATYELLRTGDGRVFIRYLPKNATIGEEKPHLTIGTYPLANAFAATRAASRKKGAIRISLGGKGVAFTARSNPDSVYLAYPGSDVQVEVFDPEPARAQELVAAGRIKAVKPRAAAGSKAGSSRAAPATRAKLEALASSLGHPVYWAGARPRVTYEVSQTPDGRSYVRYLPRGVRAGANKPYLTIGTYPMKDAFAVTKRAASAKGARKVPARGGAIAFYGSTGPHSVYVAYPNSNVQIEVFDPSPARARRVVSSGQLRAVR